MKTAELSPAQVEFRANLDKARIAGVNRFKAINKPFVITRSLYDALKELYTAFRNCPTACGSSIDPEAIKRRRIAFVALGFGTIVDNCFVPLPSIKDGFDQFHQVCLCVIDNQIYPAWLSYQDCCDALGVTAIGYNRTGYQDTEVVY